eukprot:107010_1
MLYKTRKFTNINPNIHGGIIPLCKGRRIKKNIVKPKILSLTDITYKSKTNTKRIWKKKKRRRLFSTKKKYVFLKQFHITEYGLEIGKYHVHLRYLCKENIRDIQRSQPNKDMISMLKKFNCCEYTSHLPKMTQCRAHFDVMDLIMCNGIQRKLSAQDMLNLEWTQEIISLSMHEFIVHFEQYGLNSDHNIVKLFNMLATCNMNENAKGYNTRCFKGLLLIFGANYFHNFFKTGYDIYPPVFSNSKWYNYSQKDFVNEGIKHIIEAFRDFEKIVTVSHQRIKFKCTQEVYNFHLVFWARAKVAHYFEKDFDNAKIYYLCAAVSSRISMQLRAISINGIYQVCGSSKNKEYLIALKALKIAFQICADLDTNMLPVLRDTYKKKRYKLMKRCIEELRCGNCGMKHKHNIRLRSCKGCMKLNYCSKYCQKKHWNAQHRETCDMIWKSAYNALLVMKSMDLDLILKIYKCAALVSAP